MKKPTREKRTTISDVAKDAGVSVSAVSKVMRNAYGVSAPLRKKVETSIEKLGYRPIATARGMRGKTSTIGVLLNSMKNPFSADLVRGVRTVADIKKNRMMMGVGRAHLSIEKDLIESMIDHQMDGLILISPRLSPEVIEKYARQIPIVCIAYYHPDAIAFDTVNTNDVKGAELAVKHLLLSGSKNIGMVNLERYPEFETSVMNQREIGYKNVMKDIGAEKFIQILSRNPNLEHDTSELYEYITSQNKPDAIFCWSDLDALILKSLAFKENIKIPKDLLVVGFDNSPISAMPEISLSSIYQDGEKLGELATEILFERINGRDEPRHNLIEPELIVRNSSLK